jgi:hypothetical protein
MTEIDDAVAKAKLQLYEQHREVTRALQGTIDLQAKTIDQMLQINKKLIETLESIKSTPVYYPYQPPGWRDPAMPWQNPVICGVGMMPADGSSATVVAKTP